MNYLHLDGEIRNGCHVMSVRVYYEDTDFSASLPRQLSAFHERGRTTTSPPPRRRHRAVREADRRRRLLVVRDADRVPARAHG